MTNIEYHYNLLKDTPSDINEFLPTLVRYASECKHITEFGIRAGVSTTAFIYSRPNIYRGYDIGMHENRDLLESLAKENNIDFSITYKSTLDVEIEPTDLLFIDTYHCFSQLIQELFLHGRKVNKYIIFHDTIAYKDFDEGHCKYCKQPLYASNDLFPTFGLLPAINLFMKETKMFAIVEDIKTSPGLMVIKRL